MGPCVFSNRCLATSSVARLMLCASVYYLFSMENSSMGLKARVWSREAIYYAVDELDVRCKEMI